MTLADLPSPDFTGADLSARVNAALLEARASRRFATVGALLADTTMAYGAGTRAVASGDAVEAGGHRYEVAASGAADHQLVTAGGVRLYVRPAADGTYSFAAMGPAANGTTDDFPKLRLLLDAVLTGTGWYRSGPTVFLPNGRYFMGQTIELKEIVRLTGNSSGLPADSGPELIFPADTTGIIVHRYNTLGGGVEATATTGADSSIIEGLKLSSTVGTDPGKHGIWLRARAVVRNVHIQGFSGNGVNIVASAGGGASVEGNANNWRLDTLRIQGCGGHGVYADNADANAGTAVAVDASANRLRGIYDSSFLGNTWIGCHVDANCYDSVNGRSAYATFNGGTYHAVPGATETQLRTTQPGTNAAVWRACGPTSYALAWTGSNPVGTFRQGGGYHGDDPNARSLFLGSYAEGGQGLTWLSQHSLAVGGFLAEVPVVSGVWTEGRFGDVWSPTGFVSQGTNAAGTTTVLAELGGDANNGDVLRWSRTGENDWRVKFAGSSSSDVAFVHANSDGRVPLFFTGENTAYWMGTSGPVRYTAVIPTLALGAGTTVRRQTTGTAAPASGAWAPGDIVWNASPAAGGFAGWICTAGGSPGTWKTFGAIS